MEKTALLSLASDLKRISQSIQRNSNSNIVRFSQEAEKWLKEAQKTNDHSIAKLLNKINKVLKRKNDLIKAEDCLMYSVLLQNRSVLARRNDFRTNFC